ncbi:hypothetical protein E4T38_08842 [Aureobasidium subglaciale]|nr:hypothetical protein E4T38_08842 [Aureobasidium subglaciale]KAI5214739.1 hypothetical protein E4T40_08799 [Aureobasidium subglaciale]KAI5217698.1 hypothetical protein E4T41_08709 [Aureobasidium subglaciale]KAI5255356.1 hypothetical protein E4T46_08743 [Aureobasidium subglaciale]
MTSDTDHNLTSSGQIGRAFSVITVEHVRFAATDLRLVQIVYLPGHRLTSEQKIDSMEERLSGIESQLTETNNMLRALLSRGELASTVELATPTLEDSRVHSEDNDISQTTSFGGETSMIAHSRRARGDVERLLQSIPSTRDRPEISLALDALRKATQNRSGDSSSLLHDVCSIDYQKIALDSFPPYEIVLDMVRDAQASDSLFFFIWSPFFTPPEFLHLCNQLYHMCGAMHYMLIEELSAKKTRHDPAYWSFASAFLAHFEAYLRSYSVLTSPSTENVMAIVFGAAHAIQKADFASAWPLVSMACSMCQALGWHKISEQNLQQTQAQRILFWVVYYFDRCLSLRLSRSAVLQDNDITVGYPSEPSRPEYRSWYMWFRILVDVATMHGHVYERLYSPGSMKHSSRQRSDSIQELVTGLDAISKTNSEIIKTTMYRKQYMVFLVKSNLVVIGCLRTLIYRSVVPAASETHISLDPRCVLAARDTIRYHLDVTEMLQGKQDGSATDYASWTILNCPFTPFVVLFCHIISTFDEDDLILLQSFTKSLEDTDTRSPNSMKDFHNLCEAFSSLARQYVAACKNASSGSALFAQTTDSAGDLNFLLPDGFEEWLSGSQNLDQIDWTSWAAEMT